MINLSVVRSVRLVYYLWTQEKALCERSRLEYIYNVTQKKNNVSFYVPLHEHPSLLRKVN